MGWPSVAWGLAHISSKELAEWMAYDKISPFGDDRQDLRFAMLMALLANINRDTKKRQAAYEPKDFMPRFGSPDDEEKVQPWQEQLKFVEMLNAALGGDDKRKPNVNPRNTDSQSGR